VLAATYLSRDAGRYLCNASYFAGLEARGPATLFVHLPMPRGARPGDSRPSLAEMEAALLEIALVVIRRAQGPLTTSARKLGYRLHR
jgi:pyroglutamyl-peptidase